MYVSYVVLKYILFTYLICVHVNFTLLFLMFKRVFISIPLSRIQSYCFISAINSAKERRVFAPRTSFASSNLYMLGAPISDQHVLTPSLIWTIPVNVSFPFFFLHIIPKCPSWTPPLQHLQDESWASCGMRRITRSSSKGTEIRLPPLSWLSFTWYGTSWFQSASR